MKLVIDIDEETYNEIMDDAKNTPRNLSHYERIIAKGNPIAFGDAISRQAAIDAMATWDWQELYLPIHFKQLLEGLPSVSTEKTGHWIYICNSEVNGLKICKCSNCEKKTYGSHNYCPNCGAKMEV